jgi:predicted 3-demethylubiquinone-9 3-methyltransferase (glyoxalase superfamily)
MATVQKIIPNLWFDDQAEEAARFYTSVFKNSQISEITHYGEAGPRPAGMVMTVAFELDGQQFVALNGGPEFTFNEAISLEVRCETQDEVDYYWERLTEGGGEEGPCGWLKDRYGVSWQVVPTALVELISDPDPNKSQSVMAAMLQMGKLDIQTLRDAYKQA